MIHDLFSVCLNEPEYGFICAFKKIKYKFKNLYLFNYGNK